jgi:hypothetical protein
VADEQLDLQRIVPPSQLLSDLSVEIKTHEHPEDRAVRLKIEEAKAFELLVRNKFRFYIAATMLILLFLVSIVDLFADTDLQRKQFAINALTAILAGGAGYLWGESKKPGD